MSRLSAVETVMRLTGKTDEELVSDYVDMASGIILQRLYPFRDDITEVPERYLSKLVEIATYLIDKIGAEGQTAHSENGVSRTYESASVPDSMLKSITPFGGMLGRKVQE